ncbi:helix-turn-helix domain-containing protein [Streptomyces sp. NPDC051561]|uniref:helix-turn-helix domain-containing protein n=1 Tax=Streptomyces sp. NPDC051561 TaxID=3365658 RepID=UPI00379EDD31
MGDGGGVVRGDGQDEGQEEREREPGMEILHVFGRQLKCLRVRVGMERAELGARTGYSASTVASYEQGRRIPPPRFIDRADEAVDAGGALKEMKEEVERAQYPAFFRDAAGLERLAVELLVFANQAVPGLLQTEAYTRAVLAMRRPLLEDAVVEQRVASRLMRQEIYSRRPAPLLSFVIDEAVLRRPYGGRAVYRGQLEQILLVGQHRNVEIQMMPLNREDNAGVDGAFTVLTRSGGRQVAYTETQGRSSMVTEPAEAQAFASRYGIIRAQALTPSESLTFIEKLLGEV